MKSAVVLASLAAAVAALPQPKVSEVKQATTCPGLDGVQVQSNNNQGYKLSCHKWVDSDSVIRITDTEVGYQGCLTACDGTIGCGVVQYIATDAAQTKGSCTVFPKNATSTIKENSQANEHGWTLAIPMEPKPKVFSGLALRSASPIHFVSVNAAGGQFFLNKNTATSCPSGVAGVDCAHFTSNQTLFTQAADSTTLSLHVSVPGGQQVYVTQGDGRSGQLAGALKFTPAHSAQTSGAAVYKGFTTTADGNLQFEGKDWFACPTAAGNNGGSSRSIWSAARLPGSHAAGCLAFSLRTAPRSPRDADTTAWQYV